MHSDFDLPRDWTLESSNEIEIEQLLFTIIAP